MFRLFKDVPLGMLFVNRQGEIIFHNKKASESVRINNQEKELVIYRVLPKSSIIQVIKDGKMNLTQDEFGYFLEVPIEQNEIGLIILFTEEEFHELVNHGKEVRELKQEMEAIMNLIGELVTITDRDGIVLRVSAACESIMGVKQHEFVGKPAAILEDNGVVTSSSTKQVIEKKQKITVHQQTKSGRKLLVNGHPIFDENGKLKRVINISKDITEEATLRKNLEEAQEILKYYQEEMVDLLKKDHKILLKSKAMEHVYSVITRIADVESTVLLLGETGVGKEVIARTIHQLSPRKDASFIRVNCGAIPENLMESELFGYSKGTFTGGSKTGKKGLLLAANKGILFLDEIGELPFNLQSKLLHVLQEKQFTPLGQTSPIDVDIRIVAATNRDLEEMVKSGHFREDLYYRLFVVPITIPSLRERREDIPFLINHFVELYNQKYHQVKSVDYEVTQLLIEQNWDGNVRELQNLIERLIVTIPGDQIKLCHLPNKYKKQQSMTPFQAEGLPLKKAVEAYEKSLIEQVLQHSRTMKEASVLLGVDISTISRKIRKYDLHINKNFITN